MKKFMAVALSATLLAVLAFGLMGCGSDHPLVGTWSGIPFGAHNTPDTTLTFNANGIGTSQDEYRENTFVWSTEENILRLEHYGDEDGEPARQDLPSIHWFEINDNRLTIYFSNPANSQDPLDSPSIVLARQ